MYQFIAILFLLLVQACSESTPAAPGAITKKQCDALGGKLVGGQCQQELSKEEMKKICDSLKQRYDEQLNGCIQQ